MKSYLPQIQDFLYKLTILHSYRWQNFQAERLETFLALFLEKFQKTIEFVLKG